MTGIRRYRQQRINLTMKIVHTVAEYIYFGVFFTDINECVKNPCKNGAECVNLPGTYRCDCESGYTGKHCETGNLIIPI